MVDDSITAIHSQFPTGTTSSGLLGRLKAREPAAWRQLADLYGPLVYSWCRRHGLRPEDAADVLQEVMAAVATAIDRFQIDRRGGRFRGWLWTITRSKVFDHFRRQAGREEATGGSDALRRLADLPEQLPQSADCDDRGAMAAVVQRAVQLVRTEFEQRTWDAFWAAVIQRQPTSRVAEQLGMSPNAVRLARSRVLSRLRSILGDLDD